MLSRQTEVAHDADELANLIRPAHGPLILLGSGRFEARVTHIDFGCIWTQHVEESLPRAWHIQMQGHRFGMAFCEAPQLGRTWRGEIVPADQPLVAMPDSEGWDQVDGDARWCSMSI